MRTVWKQFVCSAVAMALTGIAAASHAQEFPSGTVSLIVGFAPGGESDAGARGIAPFWEKELGVPVVVENRTGAAMQVALEYAWARPHDGHTILWHNQQYLSALEVSDSNLPYATEQWVWLDVMENDPAVVVVRDDSPWNSIEELVADMKKRPGEITLGLLTGSVQLLGCKTLFEDILGLKFREVPQSSGASMRTSLVGGHIDAICTNAVGTYSLGDEVQALAAFQSAGSQLLPDAKPVNAMLQEMGVQERIPDLGSLRGPAVPRDFAEGNPNAFQKLYASYQSVRKNPEYQAWLKEAGRSTITETHSLEESKQMIKEYNAFFQKHKDVFLGK